MRNIQGRELIFIPSEKKNRSQLSDAVSYILIRLQKHSRNLQTPHYVHVSDFRLCIDHCFGARPKHKTANTIIVNATYLRLSYS